MGRLVALVFAGLLLLAGCAADDAQPMSAQGDPDDDTSGGQLSVTAVDIEDGQVVLTTGCWEDVEGDAELDNGQIVVTELAGSGKIDGECGTVVPLDLDAGPDVVDPANGVRFALVGDRYRGVDFCGVETQRCVPFPTDDVPASCSTESLRFATVGMYNGVYPVETVRCEESWALLDLDTCGGYHGTDGLYCDGYGVQRILLAAHNGQWTETGFEQEYWCPDPGGFGAALPEWVCDHPVT